MDEGVARLFNKEAARHGLGTKIIGSKIFSYGLIDSTNDRAHFLAQNNEPEGTVVFAKGQSRGRGRFGRPWVSPYGKGLYFSLILRPRMSPQEASRITLTFALAVAITLEKMKFAGVSIKWPNDILIGDKKVCGILTEMNLANEKINYVVLGVGLNVNAPKSELPIEATSLKVVFAREFDIEDLSHIIMREMDYLYGLLLKDKFSDIIHRIKEFSGLILGGRVRVSREDKVVEGYAVDFDEYGNLIIRRDNGLLEQVTSGHLEKLG